MDNDLIRILTAAGKGTEVVRLENGSEVLLLPHGGRVLGLFAAGEKENFYWTNPVLKDAGTAGKFFASDEWQNTGGDRTWLAPEIDFFFPEYPNLNVYHQPRQFDAKPYDIVEIEGAPGMRIEFEIKHAKRQPIGVRLSKSIENAANPLRHEGIWNEMAGVTFTGYGLRTTLEFCSTPAPKVPVGLWHLIQMPHGGEMLVPTYGKARPKIVFGKIPPGDLSDLPSGGTRYRMTAKDEQKISVRAVSCTGRVAYRYEAAGTWHLVLRNFFTNPSGEYVDAPWTEPDDLGYGVQACNVNGKWGIFSELEYHIPAIGVPGAPTRTQDFAQVWAYRGNREQIARITEALLGIAG